MIVFLEFTDDQIESLALALSVAVKRASSKEQREEFHSLLGYVIHEWRVQREKELERKRELQEEE